MSAEIGMDITKIGDPDAYKAKWPDDDDFIPVREADARNHLNIGNFTRAFNEYRNAQYGGEYSCCLLAAVAMRLGANISLDQRTYLRTVYRECIPFPEGVFQMKVALREYRNGVPYELVDIDDGDCNMYEIADRDLCRPLSVSPFTLVLLSGRAPTWLLLVKDICYFPVHVPRHEAVAFDFCRLSNKRTDIQHQVESVQLPAEVMGNARRQFVYQSLPLRCSVVLTKGRRRTRLHIGSSSQSRMRILWQAFRTSSRWSEAMWRVWEGHVLLLSLSILGLGPPAQKRLQELR